MNNKRGGVGAKILLVLVLMLLAAGGGGYGFRVFDGKMAIRDAQKVVKDIEIEDYDTEEAAQIQVHLNNVTKDLETAQTRKEVYEIMDEFKEEVAKIQTKSEKELEAAKREAEEARKANQNNQNSQSNQNNQIIQNDQNTYGSDSTDTSVNSGTDPSGLTQNPADSAAGSGTENSGYKSNDLNEAEDSTSGGILNSLFGNNDGDN